MTKKIASIISAVVLILAFASFSSPPQADACEEEYFTVHCEIVCDYLGGVWSCTGSNSNRCCWEHVEGGSCGEGAISECPECNPGGCGF